MCGSDWSLTQTIAIDSFLLSFIHLQYEYFINTINSNGNDVRSEKHSQMVTCDNPTMTFARFKFLDFHTNWWNFHIIVIGSTNIIIHNLMCSFATNFLASCHVPVKPLIYFRLNVVRTQQLHKDSDHAFKCLLVLSESSSTMICWLFPPPHWRVCGSSTWCKQRSQYTAYFLQYHFSDCSIKTTFPVFLRTFLSTKTNCCCCK